MFVKIGNVSFQSEVLNRDMDIGIAGLPEWPPVYDGCS